MKRRQFLKTSLAVAGGTLCFSPVLNEIRQSAFGEQGRRVRVQPSDTPAKVVVAKGEIESAIDKAIERLGGMQRFVANGSNVLLKPNVSFPIPPEWGGTTHPRVIKKVAEMAFQAGAERVAIIEFPLSRAQFCFEQTGVKSLLAEMPQLKLIELEKERQFIEVEIPNGKALSKVKIASVITKFDTLINLPHAKSHSATQVSFGFKNLMGLIWDRSYLHENTDIHQAIAELGTVIKPHLTIVDAAYCLATGGPQGPGKTEKLDMIIASVEPLAADAFACTIANWNRRSITAEHVPHLKAAYQLGLGEIDVSRMEVDVVKVG